MLQMTLRHLCVCTGLQATTSDLDTLTPDQMNLDALLQSKDYFTNTQSDLASTTDLAYSAKVAPGLRGSLDRYPVGRSRDLEQSSRMTFTLGSTSEMSLPAGLTGTLEQSEENFGAGGTGGSDKHPMATYTMASEGRISPTYPDSLEGTGGVLGDTGGSEPHQGPANGRGPARHVSVMIPSVGEEDTATEESPEEVSQISLGH